jgi:hypothetical protein
MNYYFLAASLPGLTLEAPPPFSYDQFVALCDGHLRPADRHALTEIEGDASGASRHAVVRDWHRRDVRLRNAIARARAARSQRDATPFLREEQGVDMRVERTVSDAFSKPTPLERERVLDRFRWEQAEELAGLEPFSGRALIAYALKLKLAARWASLDEQRGATRADEIINTEGETPSPEGANPSPEGEALSGTEANPLVQGR